MSLIIRESPVIRVEGKPRDPDQMIKEGEFAAAFFEFKFFMPAIALGVQEMTDDEVVMAAAEHGTFQFLDSAEEDRYSSRGPCG